MRCAGGTIRVVSADRRADTALARACGAALSHRAEAVKTGLEGAGFADELTFFGVRVTKKPVLTPNDIARNRGWYALSSQRVAGVFAVAVHTLATQAVAANGDAGAMGAVSQNYTAIALVGTLTGFGAVHGADSSGGLAHVQAQIHWSTTRGCVQIATAVTQ